VQGSNRDYSNSSGAIPSRFRIKRKQRNGRANQALAYDGSARRLFKMLESKHPCFYSLHHHHLFLDKKHTAKHLIYDRATIEIWKDASRERIKPPYFFRLEVGKEGKIHLHVIAAKNAGFLEYKKDYETRTIRLIKDTDADRHRVISYLQKSPVPIFGDCDDIQSPKLADSQERLDDYFNALKRAKREGYRDVPQLSGYVFK
jgi:hypothetical protein